MKGVKILGLTGSIGMGKSETARMFRRLGVPVFDADAAVHKLLGKGGKAAPAIAKAFPGVVDGGAVDRKKLGAAVFNNPPALRQLEAIVHPLVREREHAFLRRAAQHRRPLVVLDVPLLLETAGEGRCDYVAVVTAPAHVQKYRVLQRPGMTEARLNAILAQQMPDRVKRQRADFLIHTGLGKAYAFDQVRRIVRFITGSQQIRPASENNITGT